MQSDNLLHLVAFDIPFPANYGGAIDVFYKVKNLSEHGMKIILHCPQYGERTSAKELEMLCEKVFYYPRLTGLKGLQWGLPYMVSSRRDKQLLENLQKIDAPIFFDGVSTSYYLAHHSLQNRLKILRPQNLEQDFYRLMAKREASWLKKIYYRLESRLLKKYEAELHTADAFFTVARHDYYFFKKHYPEAYHQYLPSFQPYNEVVSKLGEGDFCLYHGNMTLAENKEAVMYLLREVMPLVNVPFIISGRHPDKEIIHEASKLTHCKIIANPDNETMAELISNAQIHLLPTFVNTGLKLKLLQSAFSGRHIVANKDMVYGTGLEKCCHIANTAHEFAQQINTLFSQPFEISDIENRKDILANNYDNSKNAEAIISFLRQKSL